MAFAEKLKKKIRDRADGRCCMSDCHKVDIDIHHIVPQADGGSDTEDNAAPLCAGCHRTHGGDQNKRKMIKEHRDRWYKAVAGREIGSVVRSSPYTSFRNCRYAFDRDEFIHPRVLRQLLGPISSDGADIVGINLTETSFGYKPNEFTIVEGEEGKPLVKWDDSQELDSYGESFAYRHIATSPSGIDIVYCVDSGGGSGIFVNIGLFYLEQDRALMHAHRHKTRERNPLTRERAIIKTLGFIPLGDRYDGKITYSNGLLSIGPDVGWFDRGKGASQEVEVP